MAELNPKQELLKQIAELEESRPLGALNCFGVGGTADFYTEAKSSLELAAAVKAACDAKIPYTVIAQGQGVLFGDGGFPGLVIRNLSEAMAFSGERSQIVVDSGLSLQQFITRTAAQGFGGLTKLYPLGGSIGAAVYRNSLGVVSSSLRYLTVLTPPTRLQEELKIARYKADWLLKEGQSETRLALVKASQGLEYPQPVLLTLTFQLTSIRPDELALRLQKQAVNQRLPGLFGPVFQDLPGTSAEELLKSSQVSGLRVGGLQPDKRQPNYLRLKGRGTTAREVRELIELMQAAVLERYHVPLELAYEFSGVW